MECMKAYGGNNVINMVLKKYHAAKPNEFKGSGTASGYKYSYNVVNKPVANLKPGSTTNVDVQMNKVHIVLTSVSGQGPSLDKNLSMKASGKVGISSGIFSVISIKVEIENPNLIEAVLQGVINSQVVPKIQDTLKRVPLPQLQNIFGPGLSAQVQSGSVITGPAFEVGARITGKTGLSAADKPASSDLTLLNNGSDNNATLIGVVSAGAVNYLIERLIPPMSKSFNESGSKVGFGAGIKGTIKASTPVLKISAGNCTAYTTVSITLKAGIKVPIKGWTWVSIPVPNVKTGITNTLTAQGNKGVVTLTGVDSIKVSFSWPSVLKPVESIVKSLLNGVLSLFKGTISNAVKGRKFEIFQLPTKIPGTNLSTSVSFRSSGLSYYKSSIKAMVRLQG